MWKITPKTKRELTTPSRFPQPYKTLKFVYVISSHNNFPKGLRYSMALVGGISQVDDESNSLEIENLAKFAVDDHNTKENAMLDFVKVVNTKKQVVAGKMYYITLEAKDGDKQKVYETKVWVKPWVNFKEVQEFKYLGDAPASSDGSSS